MSACFKGAPMYTPIVQPCFSLIREGSLSTITAVDSCAWTVLCIALKPLYNEVAACSLALLTPLRGSPVSHGSRYIPLLDLLDHLSLQPTLSHLR